MPKQTFFNLPDDKRDLIVEIAVEEFAEHGFEGASISQMVSRMGIAKGSFYQYFDDKRDLFMHLVDLIAQEKAAYFKDRQPPDPNLDFFGYLRWMIEAGFEFNTARPRLAQAVSRVLFGEGLYLGEMFKDLREVSSGALTALMQQAIDQGHINPQIDPRVATFVFETLLNNVSAFILEQQDTDPQALMQGDIGWLLSDRSRAIMDGVLRVLEHGLRRPSDGE